ncbi:Tab2/Atab2 family RNA-binding protein [Leptothermofonsia sichuanensis E412]|nr:Tab2/Atab2 family RNA-binding protein [Leptothermofonsia sichuanensis]QZZ23592.1 Tab2/Atab2 family RNA-binding protein [Leptothermofonsia sichuanensis E412]
MTIWEVDFYRRPLRDENGEPLWELLICDTADSFRHNAFCPQAQAGREWLVTRLEDLVVSGLALPETIRVFRPQAFNLLQAACMVLGITAEPTRHTPILKRWLEEHAREYPALPNYTGEPYHPLALEQPPPVPLPEKLWGDRWGFTHLPAADLVEAFRDRPIPILVMPEFLFPINLNLASTVPIPGVVITAGRRSMSLARWLQEARPVSLNYIAGAPDGLILEAGLSDRWVVVTFADAAVRASAQTFESRKQQSHGLHFLLVQPDDSGMTYSGFWLLKQD